MISTETLIGKVVHFYNKIGVAVLALSGELKNGETLHFSGKSTNFNQTAGSLQVEHRPIQTAQAGADVGLKTDQPVREGDLVYKVS